jgi:CBS domain-containing protein
MTRAAILKHKGDHVVYVGPTIKIVDLARALAARRIGAAAVRDDAGKLLGIITERDVLFAIGAHGHATLDMTADQLMTRDVKTIDLGAPVRAAVALMDSGHFRHLPVTDEGRLCGILSIRDLLKAYAAEQEGAVEGLKAWVTGAT